MTSRPIVHYLLWKKRARHRRVVSHVGGAASVPDATWYACSIQARLYRMYIAALAERLNSMHDVRLNFQWQSDHGRKYGDLAHS